MRSVSLLVGLVLLIAFLSAGCDFGNSAGSEPGTVTVRVTNISSIPIGGELSIGIKTAGAPPIPDLTGLLSSTGFQFVGADDEVVLTLVTFEEGVGPTGDLWTGESGWSKYDLYVLIETGFVDNEFNEIGDFANGFPGPVAINGDTTITFRYPDDFRAFE
jgi:hypothetical protein